MKIKEKHKQVNDIFDIFDSFNRIKKSSIFRAIAFSHFVQDYINWCEERNEPNNNNSLLEFYEESNKDIIINDAEKIFLKHTNSISEEYINKKLSHLNSEVLKLRKDNRFSFIKGVAASIVAVIIVGAWNYIPDGSINKLIDQAQATMKTDK